MTATDRIHPIPAGFDIKKNKFLDMSTEFGNPGDFLSQIIYPDSLVSVSSHAYLVGWNLDSFRCCIACAIEISSDQHSDLQITISEIAPPLVNILEHCSRHGSMPPTILGVWIPDSNLLPQSHMLPPENASIWISLSRDRCDGSALKSTKPQLNALYSLGCQYKTSCYMIQYQSFNTDLLTCLSGDVASRLISGRCDCAPLLMLTDLEFIVSQINAAHDLSQAINAKTESVKLGHECDALRVTRLAEVCGCILRPAAAAVDVLAWLWIIFANTLRRLLEHKINLSNFGIAIAYWLGIRGSGIPSQSGSGLVVLFSMCDISLTAAHLSQKLLATEKAFCQSATFSRAWRHPVAWRKHFWTEIHSFAVLCWIDLTIGCLVGWLIFMQSQVITDVLTAQCSGLQKKLLVDAIEWFNHSPGGVKLNPLITAKIGAALQLVIAKFGWFFTWTAPLHAAIVKVLACFGVLGVTTQLDLVADVIRIFTFHIALIHRVCAVQHTFQLKLIYSLWHLFQGMKINILRKRVDTCEYDRQQLLFGTVLFAMNIFLFPSFAAYFYLFALAQFFVVFVQYFLWSISIGVKEFPLYALAVWIRDPRSCSDGIEFHVDVSAAAMASLSSLGSDSANNNVASGQSQANDGDTLATAMRNNFGLRRCSASSVPSSGAPTASEPAHSTCSLLSTCIQQPTGSRGRSINASSAGDDDDQDKARDRARKISVSFMIERGTGVNEGDSGCSSLAMGDLAREEIHACNSSSAGDEASHAPTGSEDGMDPRDGNKVLGMEIETDASSALSSDAAPGLGSQSGARRPRARAVEGIGTFLLSMVAGRSLERDLNHNSGVCEDEGKSEVAGAGGASTCGDDSEIADEHTSVSMSTEVDRTLTDSNGSEIQIARSEGAAGEAPTLSLMLKVPEESDGGGDDDEVGDAVEDDMHTGGAMDGSLDFDDEEAVYLAGIDGDMDGDGEGDGDVDEMQHHQYDNLGEVLDNVRSDWDVRSEAASPSGRVRGVVDQRDERQGGSTGGEGGAVLGMASKQNPSGSASSPSTSSSLKRISLQGRGLDVGASGASGSESTRNTTSLAMFLSNPSHLSSSSMSMGSGGNSPLGRARSRERDAGARAAPRVTCTHVALAPRRFPFAKLFEGFAGYWRYLVATKGLLIRLCLGIVIGHPALDIQLIQSSIDLNHRGAHAGYILEGCDDDDEELSKSVYLQSNVLLSLFPHGDSKGRRMVEGADNSSHAPVGGEKSLLTAHNKFEIREGNGANSDGGGGGGGGDMPTRDSNARGKGNALRRVEDVIKSPGKYWRILRNARRMSAPLPHRRGGAGGQTQGGDRAAHQRRLNRRLFNLVNATNAVSFVLLSVVAALLVANVVTLDVMKVIVRTDDHALLISESNRTQAHGIAWMGTDNITNFNVVADVVADVGLGLGVDTSANRMQAESTLIGPLTLGAAAQASTASEGLGHATDNPNHNFMDGFVTMVQEVRKLFSTAIRH